MAGGSYRIGAELISTFICVTLLSRCFVMYNVVAAGDNRKEGNFGCDAHSIQEFTVSYCDEGKCCMFGIMPYFRVRGVPPAAVPTLFIVLCVVLPVVILSILYIVSLKVAATYGAAVTVISIVLTNRKRIIEGKIYFFLIQRLHERDGAGWLFVCLSVCLSGLFMMSCATVRLVWIWIRIRIRIWIRIWIRTTTTQLCSSTACAMRYAI